MMDAPSTHSWEELCSRAADKKEWRYRVHAMKSMVRIEKREAFIQEQKEINAAGLTVSTIATTTIESATATTDTTPTPAPANTAAAASACY